MIATTTTCGIKNTSAIAPCDDSKIPFPKTNKSITIVIGIESHIQLRLIKYNISTDKIGGAKNIMIEIISLYRNKKSVIASPHQI